MDREQGEENLTVQGVGSPVPASVRGEHAGLKTSIYSDCKKKNNNPSAGVANLAPTERTATSKKNEDAFDPLKGGSKLLRSPPPGVEPPAGQSIQLEPSPIAEKMDSITQLKTPRNRAKIPEDVFLQEISNCVEALKTMKLACSKQKNVSKDIKNGMERIEEALDKMKWHHKRSKSTIGPTAAEAIPETEPSTKQIPAMVVSKGGSQDEGSKINEEEDREFAAPASAKRPPSSPLAKKQGKRTRKSPTRDRHNLAVEGEENSPKESVLEEGTSTAPEQESYAKTLKGNVPDVNKATTSRSITEEPGKPKTKARETEKSQTLPVKSFKKQRNKKKRSTIKTRTEAIVIKPNGDGTFTDILREIKEKAKPEDTETTVKKVRQTKAGNVLLELGAKAKNKTAFGRSLQEILGERATVRNLDPKITIEIRDIDELTTEEEVQEAVRKKAENPLAEVKVFLTGKNRRALKTAIVEISQHTALEILKTPVVKIGWNQCKIRRR